eukprot:Pgem_evm1s2229
MIFSNFFTLYQESVSSCFTQTTEESSNFLLYLKEMAVDCKRKVDKSTCNECSADTNPNICAGSTDSSIPKGRTNCSFNERLQAQNGGSACNLQSKDLECEAQTVECHNGINIRKSQVDALPVWAKDESCTGWVGFEWDKKHKFKTYKTTHGITRHQAYEECVNSIDCTGFFTNQLN